MRFEVEKCKYFKKAKEEKVNEAVEKQLQEASKKLFTLSEVKAKRFLQR